MFAGLFTGICLQKKAVAEIVNVALIFQALSRIRHINNQLPFIELSY